MNITPTPPSASEEKAIREEMPRMTPGIYAGELTMFPSEHGQYCRLSDAEAQLAELRAKRSILHRALAQIIEADDAHTLSQQLIELGRAALAADGKEGAL